MTNNNIVLSYLRTGNGDQGDTKLGSKSYRKSHPLVKYVGSLDSVQSATTALPRAWGNFQPRNIMQELLFQLGAVVASRKPGEIDPYIQEISTLMENQIEFITSSLPQLTSFLRVDEVNFELMVLRTKIREAEIKCVEAFDYTTAKAKELNENLLISLSLSMQALNVASDWVFAFVWLYSVGPNNEVPNELVWVPWTEEKIRKLNV